MMHELITLLAHVDSIKLYGDKTHGFTLEIETGVYYFTGASAEYVIHCAYNHIKELNK